jgi:hypothetical protein
MKPNVELLRATLAHIEAHPETWNQQMWSNECGTAFCFAGHAVVLSGCTVNPEREQVLLDTVPAEFHDTFREITGGWNPPIALAAAVLLGLYDTDAIGRSQTIRLFNGDNTLEDLRSMVAELCGQDAEAEA